jgi:hypothetical protein
MKKERQHLLLVAQESADQRLLQFFLQQPRWVFPNKIACLAEHKHSMASSQKSISGMAHQEDTGF